MTDMTYSAVRREQCVGVDSGEQCVGIDSGGSNYKLLLRR
jgi:hypothetical protein